MKCKTKECFANNAKYRNGCAALVDIADCRFFKTEEQITEEEKTLIECGHPVYKPSVTRQDQRTLKALLNGDGKTTEYMDKT